VSLGANAFLTLDEVKVWLGKQQETQDERALIEQLINGLTEAIEKEIRRPVKARARTERHHGPGSRRLWLDVRPAASVTVLRLLNYDGTVYRTFATTDYYLDGETGSVFLFKETFPLAMYNVEVTYTAGWSTVPESLKLAAQLWIRKLWKDRDTERDEIASISVNGTTTTHVVGPMPPTVKSLLAPFRLAAGAA
jgi:hypothetical protein